MKHHVDIFHDPMQFPGIPYVGKKKAGVMPKETLLQEKELAFVVVDAYDLGGVSIFHKLADQFTADGAAGAGNQDSFVFESVHFRLKPFFFSGIGCDFFGNRGV
jgi:hypothetical protein